MKKIQLAITFSFFFSQAIDAKESIHVWERIGPHGGGTELFIESPRHPDTLFTVTTSSISSTAQQYLKSNNGGDSWVTVPFTRELEKFPIFDLAVDSANPHTLFAISDDGKLPSSQVALLKSTDAGMHWHQIAQNIANIDFYSFIRLNAPFDQSLQVFIEMEGSHEFAMAVSHDGGDQWEITDKKISSINGNPVNLIARDYANSTILYGSYSEGVGRTRTVLNAGLYKSTNGGGDWSNITPPDLRVSSVTTVPENSNKLYAQFIDLSFHQINMVSINGGQSWEPFGAVPGENSISLGLGNFFVDPTDSNILYAKVFPADPNFQADQGIQKIAKSIDSGKSWQVIDVSPYRPQSITINSGNNQKLLMTTLFRGVISSENGGLDWRPSNTGIRFVGGDLLTGEDDSAVMYFKVNHVGTYFKSLDAGKHWEEININIQDELDSTGNGVVCDNIILNPKQNKEIICKTGFALFKSKDAGNNWQSIFRVPDPLNNWISQVVFAIDGKTIYAVNDGVNKSINKSLDNGVSWDTVSNLIGELSTHPENAKILYNIANVDGLVKLYKSTNGGENWEVLINSNHSFDHKLLIHPTNPERLIFDDGGKAFLLSDEGGSNWTEILKPFNKENQNTETFSYQFTNITNLVFNPASLDGLIAVTEKGTFETSDLGENWVAINARFNEPLLTNSLELKVSSDAVYASSSTGSFKMTNKLDYEKASKCLFDWAEQQYPGIFSPILPVTQLWGGYSYRYYSDTNTYLGFFHEQEVHLLQPSVSNDISTHGAVEFYLNLAECD